MTIAVPETSTSGDRPPRVPTADDCRLRTSTVDSARRARQRRSPTTNTRSGRSSHHPPAHRPTINRRTLVIWCHDRPRTSVDTGLEIIRGLRGFTSGYAVPTYVIDAPGGGGKIPLMPDYVVGKDEGGVLLRNYENHQYRYPAALEATCHKEEQ